MARSSQWEIRIATIASEHVDRAPSSAGSTSARSPRPTADLLVEAHNLTKRYGSGLLAVDAINLTVRRGEVYGFLGPNGEGKTTTLRMLLGLIRPTAGTARVLGVAPGSPEGLARVGALIEGPGFYPYLSGRENLHVLAGYLGATAAQIDASLAQVGMTDYAARQYHAYSTGMKQRLGVAAALLKEPDLLILDEPTNGLDPKGVAEMRTLIRSIGRGIRTVLLSSHLLSEVEQLSDRVGVIVHGRLVAEGPLAELRGPAGLLVRAQPIEHAQRVAHALPAVTEARISDGMLRLTTDPANAAAVNRALVQAGVAVSELRPVAHSLEEVFLTLTEGTEA